MGLTRHKISYKCDCGIDYGSCGAQCAFVFVNNRTVDVYQIFHVDTHEYRTKGGQPIITEICCFGDNAIDALKKLLDADPHAADAEKLTQQELETCRP